MKADSPNSEGLGGYERLCIKTAFRMGEDNSKWSNWQTTNLENIQATPTAQLQKNKWPNQKMGQRTK